MTIGEDPNVVGKLDPEAESRLQTTKRPVAVREAMRELLLGLRAAYPGSSIEPGHAGWRAVELKKGTRIVVRVFPKDGLVKVENVLDGSKPGDYGPAIDLRQKDGEWACKLPAGGVPDELLLCIKDAVEGITEGRRRASKFASAATRGEQAKEWRRSSIRSSLRFEVLIRDGFTCQYCGRSAPDVVLHVDHRVPVAKGGTDSIENLLTACVDCNLGKGDRHST